MKRDAKIEISIVTRKQSFKTCRWAKSVFPDYSFGLFCAILTSMTDLIAQFISVCKTFCQSVSEVSDLFCDTSAVLHITCLWRKKEQFHHRKNFLFRFASATEPLAYFLGSERQFSPCSASHKRISVKHKQSLKRPVSVFKWKPSFNGGNTWILFYPDVEQETSWPLEAPQELVKLLRQFITPLLWKIISHTNHLFSIEEFCTPAKQFDYFFDTI